MTDGLLNTLNDAFQPELFVNHYGSSEIYTFTVDQNAPAKPGSAGKAGINQQIRVVRLNAKSAAEVAAPNEEGEIVALLAGDESFEGYWRRPDREIEGADHSSAPTTTPCWQITAPKSSWLGTPAAIRPRQKSRPRAISRCRW